MACVAVLSLMRTLELEFLQPHPRPILQQKELISPNKEFIQSLHGKLQSLIELFDENRTDGVEAIKMLETRLRDVAFRVEDEIELQVVHLYEEEVEEEERDAQRCSMLCQIVHRTTRKPRACPSLSLHYILQQAMQDIDAIKQELVEARNEYEHFKDQQGRKAAPLHVLPKSDEVITIGDSSHHASHSKEIMVGKHDDFEIIKEMLIGHPSKQLEVVSIKGMGGIGKTTLARRIYEDPSTISYFDKRVWVVASQHHNKRQMLLGLVGSKDNASSISDEDLALQLYQSFKCQRYLFVMDDIWSGEAWDAVKTCFPNDKNGSRVLLTTRLAVVANHTCTKDEFSHQMQLLEQSESWKLFYENACKFRGAKFETIGRPVVEKCKGLPLAIIVVAGLFSKLNTLAEWKNTANALSYSSTSTLDDEECSRVLSLSYSQLPHNLKACFLYLGVFPEDEEIYANNLARLWFAEGLVKEFENESFDAVANRYIQELMDRNLIILSEVSSCGRKIKWFRMHDLLHSFCVREAQKENLLSVVKNNYYVLPRSVRWLSIQCVNFGMPTIRSSSKSYRSFFYFSLEQAHFDFKNCNLLRVLYCHNVCVKLEKVVDIVHLRFLRYADNNVQLSRAPGFLKSRRREKVKLSETQEFLNSRRENIELSRAWNLQTLHCYKVSYRSYDGGNNSEFPQLRYINCRVGFQGNPPNFVHKLAWIRADDCSNEYIMNIPSLKKVVIVSQGRDYNDCITNLAYLEHLEGLFIKGDCRKLTPISNHILLLKNLRKLLLYDIGVEWEEINVLSMLPKLEVLGLQWKSYKGNEWEIQEEVIFCQLIVLHFFHSDLKHWEASSHNFPKLEHLLLHNCNKLIEIPIGFAEISTLKSIKLWGCLASAVKSAKNIQDEQRDYGNYNMVVIEEETLHDLEFEKSLGEEESEPDI